MMPETKKVTFFEPSDEALCLALIDFFDTKTVEKSREYLGIDLENPFHPRLLASGSKSVLMMRSMHNIWMEQNGESDGLKQNRFKRMCQVVELAWIEAKHPDLYQHLVLESAAYVIRFRGEKPDSKAFFEEHFNVCPFCNPRMKKEVTV